MNTFKRKALMSAVLAGLGVAGTAEAVYQNPNGLGQVLLYPYYTVNSSGGNSYNTLISVVNTTNRAKVVKVRFREGKNSREVLDFNLYMSPNDVFTGAVIPASADATAPGRFVTTDTSCTNPGPIPAAGVDFRNFEYTGTAADGAATGLDRTREGYVEMIELGVLNAPDSTRATHVNGVPANCAALRGNPVVFATAFSSPSGGLTGTGTLVNVINGLDMTYSAVALADFTANFFAATTIGTDVPNLGDADNVSLVVSRDSTDSATYAFVSAFADVTVTNLTATDGAQAVSATMMHNAVINEYVLDSGSRSNTDWVLTFPTKRYFTNSATAIAPFTERFTANGACETITFTFFDREEQSFGTTAADFSPLPPGGAANTLCWESTVLSIRNGAAHMPTAANTTGVLGSSNNTNVTVATAAGATFQNGWGRLEFIGTNASPAGGIGMPAAATNSATLFPTQTAFAASATTYFGLPVIGFMARTFQNNAVPCGTATCQGNFAGSFRHNYTQFITP
jgi:hypothetical protein